MAKLIARTYELHGPRDLVVTQQSIELEALGDNEIAAETRYSAVSPGTEIAAYRGDPPLRPMRQYPRLMGYCNVAEIVAVGAAVRTLRVGQIILTFQSHRSAFVCSASDIIAVVEPAIEATLATTTYLFHLGYAALLRADVRAGNTVAVLGLGAIGLTTVAVAAMAGARTFVLSDQKEALKY